MSVKERDPLTGHQTTGHEWDGITELNTPVPRAVWFFIIVTHIWALIAWILLPTWPLLTTYTKGLLGVDQQEQVEEAVVAANAQRADWATQIDHLPRKRFWPMAICRVAWPRRATSFSATTAPVVTEPTPRAGRAFPA